MSSPPPNLQRLGYQRIVALLVYLILVPTTLLLFLGILLLFFGGAHRLILGILTMSFVLALVTGVVLVWVFLHREADVAELQADFISKVSHELRTPLTSIRLFVETMERTKGDAVTHEKCVTALLAETERLTGLIERLLDWGRMESGRKQFEMREESVASIIEAAKDAFSPLKHGANIEFTSEVAAGLPNVFVDQHAIVDALVNLLSNAHKYGGTPAKIGLRAYVSPRGVCLEVSDNGPGISRPEQKRIFQKFYRIDDRLSREREGSGLGLAIVKAIAREHFARIEVESDVGQGSKFRIILPLVTEARKAWEMAKTEVKAGKL